MSIFTKSGMTEGEALLWGLKEMAEAVAERLRGHDKEIAELQAEIERLKREPRMSLAQKLRTKGQA